VVEDLTILLELQILAVVEQVAVAILAHLQELLVDREFVFFPIHRLLNVLQAET
jgi:hypothetical protein